MTAKENAPSGNEAPSKSRENGTDTAKTASANLSPQIAPLYDAVRAAITARDPQVLTRCLRADLEQNYVNIPDELKVLPAWVTWRITEIKESGKFDKVPYYPGGTRRKDEQGSPDDLAQLGTFDEAFAAFNRNTRNAGVGLAMLPGMGYVAFDADRCLDDAGNPPPHIANTVDLTYAEVSPSATGIRAFWKGDATNGKDHGRGLELYAQKQFVTVTGNVIANTHNADTSDVPILTAPMRTHLERLCHSDKGSNTKPSPTTAAGTPERELTIFDITLETVADVRAALPHLPNDTAEGYGAWIETGLALKSLSQGGFDDEARELWHAHSQRSDKYDADDCDAKWDNFDPDKVTYKTIFKLAADNGWVNPRTALTAETRLDRSDTANVNLMFRYSQGNLRYVPERDQWLVWTGERWEVDTAKSALQTACREVGEHYYREAKEQRKAADALGVPPDDRKRLAKVADNTEAWGSQCRNHRKITDMQAQAKMDSRFTLNLEQLDCDPNLLGVQNGVVDLRTGRLHPDARDQFVTRRAAFNFDPSARADRWAHFIGEITGKPIPVERDADGCIRPESVGRYHPRPDYARYIQKALGYCLTGLTSEQKMFICYGDGGNGKNIMLDILKEILPDYVAIITPALLLESSKAMSAQAPSEATASLAGNRFAIASEAKEDAKLDVAMVKAHTGNKYLTARFLNKNSTTFTITHKLWLMTNHKPRIDDMDPAIRGRLHILPFDRRWNRPGDTERDPTRPDGDKRLEVALRTETTGVLAWLVEGARMYFEEGLEPPAAVVDSTKAYIADQDSFGKWLGDNTDPCGHKDGAQSETLYGDFVSWCRLNGRKQHPSSEGDFRKALKDRRHEPVKISVMRYPLKLKMENLAVEVPNADGFDEVV